MAISVSTTGNGRFVISDQSDVIMDYSITESSTPVSLADMNGEIPSLNISGQSNNINSLNNTHPNSRLLIDNSLTMVDSLRGSFTGRVSSLSMDSQSVDLEVLSIFEKLNVVKKSASHNGTVITAFQSYMALAGIGSGNYSIDASFSQAVVFPGWNDNIWNALKMLCVAVNAEMYFQSGILYFKPRATKTLNLENIDGESFTVSVGPQTKKTIFTRNKTTWLSGAIVYTDTPLTSAQSVDAKELKKVIITTSVALNSVNQPTYITTPLFNSYTSYIQPSSIGKVPSDNLNGFYSFRDMNGDTVDAVTMSRLGASVKVELTDNPYEIQLVITGPSIAAETPWSIDFDDDVPALMVTGTGVLVNGTQMTFNTGSPIGDDQNEYTDNPFLVNSTYLYNTAYYTNQELCGPLVTFSFATDKIVEASNQEFGYLPGAVFTYAGSKYRISSVSYSYDGISVEAKQYVTFADFNTKWSGKTHAQFNSTMLDSTTYPDEYMKYSDLAILPLMEPTA